MTPAHVQRLTDADRGAGAPAAGGGGGLERFKDEEVVGDC